MLSDQQIVKSYRWHYTTLDSIGKFEDTTFIPYRIIYNFSHRILRYAITFPQYSKTTKCLVSLEQTIPREMYVDSDQLAELKVFDKVSFLHYCFKYYLLNCKTFVLFASVDLQTSRQNWCWGYLNKIIRICYVYLRKYNRPD